MRFPAALFALLLLLLISSAAGNVFAEEPDSVSLLQEQISELEKGADFTGALDLAVQLRTLVKNNPDSKPYEVGDAERLVATLTHVAALSEPAREEMAESRRLYDRIEELGAEGDYKAAAAIAKEQLAIRERHLGYEHVDVAMSLDLVGKFQYMQADYDGASKSFRDALDLRRKLLGDVHPHVASSYGNLGAAFRAQGDYAKAEEYMREGIALDRKLLGDRHESLAIQLSNLATVLRKLEDYEGARELYTEALSIYNKLYGGDHPSTANTLSNLSVLLGSTGEYADAEPLAREALAMRRRLLPADHPDIAVSLTILARVLQYQGDDAAAGELLLEALEINRKRSGNDSPTVAVSIKHLAHIYTDRGDYARAEELYREAAAIRLGIYGEEHPLITVDISDIARTLYDQGKYEQAEPLMREVLERNRTAEKRHYENYAISLNNLAKLLEAQGDYEAAEPLLEEALAAKRQRQGDQTPSVYSSLVSLGALHYYQGDYEGAERLFVQAADSYEGARVLAGSGLIRATFETSPYTRLAAARLHLGRSRDAWPSAERALGQALGELLIAAEKRQLTEEELAEEELLRQALAGAERELAVRLEIAQNDTTIEAVAGVEEARTGLVTVQSDWSAFQRDIAEKYPVSEGRAYPLEQIQTALETHEAILGWLELYRNHERDLDLWAYVIRNEGPVRWSRLESPASGPGEALQVFSEELKRPTRQVSEVVRKASRELAAERIAPVMDALDGVDKLIVIPSVLMLGIPVEALTGDDGRLLGERFIISYTPSATIYKWLKDMSKHQHSDKILLVGDPPFCEAHLAAINERATKDTNSEAPIDVSVARSALSGNRKAIASLPRLPASRAEVEGIATMSSHPRVLLGTEASEQNLRLLAATGTLQDFDVIHLATHALVDGDRPERSALVFSQVGLPDAFEAAAKGDPIYNGMVTAADVVREWELEADLVTLSACETGLGKQVSGEGYVGFIHAFLQAGARSLLVSLWKVEDRATSLLMQRFYENYLGERGRSMTKAEALQEAKKWLRDYEDDNGENPYQHPSYWSGFILVGDRG